MFPPIKNPNYFPVLGLGLIEALMPYAVVNATVYYFPVLGLGLIEA